MRTEIPEEERGFTLIELLVVLAVLSLAAGLLASSLNLAFAAPASRQRADHTVPAAQRILRDRVERLAAITRADASRPIIDARGYDGLFSFTGHAPQSDSPAPLHRYRLMLTPWGDLMLYSASSLDDRIDLNDRSLSGWEPMRLLSGVAEMKLSYFGPAPNEGVEIWQEYWIDRPQPPALVRVRLRFSGDDPRQWPDLIAAPRATSNTECRVQNYGGRCEP